jgi:hypothetical protein
VADDVLPAKRRFQPILWGVLAAVATMILLVATEPKMAIVWDEGYTLGREARVRTWLHGLQDPREFARTWKPVARELVHDKMPPPKPEEMDTLEELLRPPAIRYFWPFGREEPHGHPPFYALVGLIGDAAVPWWDTLPRARFGPMLVFSLTAGAVAAFFGRRWGPWAATAAAGGLALQPRMFAHAHYAAYDAILTCLWILAVLTFTLAVEKREGESRRWPRWGWVIAFGIVCGWAADVKLTGWFLPLPFIAWTILYRDRRALLTLLVGGIVGGLTLYVLNPPWWSDPIGGISVFFESNLTRGKTAPIKTLYLGKVYNSPLISLPWHNTLVWTLFVTPAGFLLLSLSAIPRALRQAKSEPLGLLILGHWAFLLILRAMPHVPGHDGIRLFLPAFGMLALACGLGASSWVERLGNWGKGLVLLAIAEGLVSLAVMMPVPLSYYSPLVGGLPGATARGMEPTFYWDSLDRETIDWLNRHTPPDAKIKFATEPTGWIELQQRGIMKRGLYFYEPGYYLWYVVQNRPGSMSPLDRALIRDKTPSRVVSKFGIPLIWVFPFQDVIDRQREQEALR